MMANEKRWRRFVAFIAILAFLYKRFNIEIGMIAGLAHRLFEKRFLMTILPNQEVKWLQEGRLERKLYDPAKLGLHTPEQERAYTSQLPNIVLIIADDLGYNDVSSYADDERGFRFDGALTPNINSIRRNGVDFLNAYSGHATCTPSRHALYTGRFASRTGLEYTPLPHYLGRFLSRPWPKGSPQPIHYPELERLAPHPFDNPLLPRSIPMMSEVLQALGYYNYLIGKWDGGAGLERNPINRGFNEFLGRQVGGTLYFKEHDENVMQFQGLPFDEALKLILAYFVVHNDGPKFEADGYMTDYMTRESVKLIHDLGERQLGGPWFVNVAYNAPHNPYQCLKTDFDSPELAHINSTIERIYAAMVKAVDRGVGEILEALKQSNQYNNTIVIFTSDNGGADYASIPYLNAPYRGWKTTLFEGGIKVPLFMQYPNMLHSGGVRVKEMISQIDLLPTFVTLATDTLHSVTSQTHCTEADGSIDTMTCQQKVRITDIVSNYDVDGVDIFATCPSLAPYHHHSSDAAISTSPKERHLFWRSSHYKALRKGKYKLQISERPNKVWFFDMENDATERHNIAPDVGIVTLDDLNNALQEYFVNVQNKVTLDAMYNDNQSDLIAMYLELLHVNSLQKDPAWPSFLERPVCIDKDGEQPCYLSDEHVLWAD